MPSLDEHGMLLGRLIEASVATKDAVQVLNQRQDSMAEQLAAQAAQIQALTERLAKSEQDIAQARDEREMLRFDLHQAQTDLAAARASSARAAKQLVRMSPRSPREVWAERGGIGAGGGVAGALIAKLIEHIIGLFG